MTPGSPSSLVEQFESKLGTLERDFHIAWWESQIDAAPETEKRRSELELELRRVKGDPASLAEVEQAIEAGVDDPVIRRSLEVLRLSLTGNQMSDANREEMVALSSSVENDFNDFRPEVDGQAMSDNEIENVLKTSNDPALRKATWEASKRVGAEVADRVRELARLRNRIASELGYGDYYAFSLTLQELPEEWLFATLNDLERLTVEPFRRWKGALDDKLRRRFGAEELAPWHYADPFFQALPPDGRVSLDGPLAGADASELALKTFGSWGIDLSGVIANSDLFPRAHKCQHAFCIDMDRSGKDVRILANVVPGERWVEVVLHESGHAAYDVEIDPELPWALRRAAHTFTTESIALLCGRLPRDPKWLREFAGVPDAEVRGIEAELRAATTAQNLLFSRWGLVMVHFERALYADPDADLDALWWDLVERFQLVTRPAGRVEPDWAAKIHIAVSPVYYQNYLLGDLLASQLAAACEAEVGGLVGVEGAGRLMTERMFRPGASLRWDELVIGATGRPLGADAFTAGLEAV